VTATKHVTLWCDTEGCHTFLEIGGESSFGPAREYARRFGWRLGKMTRRARSTTHDFCPEHAEEGT
jgi:hypothetical protein